MKYTSTTETITQVDRNELQINASRQGAAKSRQHVLELAGTRAADANVCRSELIDHLQSQLTRWRERPLI